MITGGKYSVCREVNRGEYLKTFFTDVVNASDLNASEKANVMTEVDNLPAEPTIDQIDAIRALLDARLPDGIRELANGKSQFKGDLECLYDLQGRPLVALPQTGNGVGILIVGSRKELR